MSGPLVMLVEDDADIRDTIVEVLEYRGFEMLSAEDGAQALARLRAAPVKPALILLDLTMPVMNGWEFMAAKALEPELAAIPVVVLSAVANIERQGEAPRWAGILSKPVGLQTLLETIRKFSASPD